jgi:hypothetical protein
MLKRIPNSYYKTGGKSAWKYQLKCEFCQQIFNSNNIRDRREGCSNPECRESFLHEKIERANNTTIRFAHSDNPNNKYTRVMHLHNGNQFLCKMDKIFDRQIIIESEIITNIENRTERICQRCMSEYKFFYSVEHELSKIPRLKQ